MKNTEKQAVTPNERRTFLSKLFTGSLTIGLFGAFAAMMAYIFPPERRAFSSAQRRKRVARREEIPVGQGKQDSFNGEPVWILHLRSGFVALSAVCTHKSCIVNWDEKRLTLTCPCHAGLFDSNGNVLAGPPNRPLARLRVEVLGEEIFIANGGESR